ncbi:MAG: hypothetical protein ACO3A2_10140 [Bdellovibrionia bacterium]
MKVNLKNFFPILTSLALASAGLSLVYGWIQSENNSKAAQALEAQVQTERQALKSRIISWTKFYHSLILTQEWTATESLRQTLKKPLDQLGHLSLDSDEEFNQADTLMSSVSNLIAEQLAQKRINTKTARAIEVQDIALQRQRNSYTELARQRNQLLSNRLLRIFQDPNPKLSYLFLSDVQSTN